MGGNVAEVEPALVRQHSSGETFQAENLAAARGLCPVLGKMSLEEAGLLLELEGIGNEKLSEAVKEPKVDKPEVKEPAKSEKTVKEVEKAEPVGDMPKNKQKEATGADKHTENLHIAQLVLAEAPKPKEPVKKEVKVIKLDEVAEKAVVPPLPTKQPEEPKATIPRIEAHPLIKEAVASAQLRDLLRQEAVQSKPEAIIEQVPIDVRERTRITSTFIAETVPIEAILAEQASVPVLEREISFDRPDKIPVELVPLSRDEDVVPEMIQVDNPEISETEFSALEFDMPQDQDEVIQPELDFLPTDVEQLISTDVVLVGVVEATEAIPLAPPKIVEQQEVAILSSLREAEPRPTEDEMFHEEVIENLAQAMTVLEPEVAIVAHELLDKAVEQIQQIKHPDESYEGVEFNEIEVIETFTEFFERAGLEYTQDEIKQFVHYMLTTETGEQDTETIDDEQINYALSDYGTHEGLVYLLSSSKTLKKLKASLHSALGRLVLLSPMFRKGEEVLVA